MLYAVPCRTFMSATIFARYTQIAIVDERQQIKHLILWLSQTVRAIRRSNGCLS